MEPSPTEEATRLIEPERTSPAANTPGQLVSRKSGGRGAFQVPALTTASPVKTKPRSSIRIWLVSQAVCGTAPMKTKRPAAGMHLATFVVQWVVSTISTDFSPWTEEI